NDFGINNGLSWVFITDKHKGLIPSVETLFPGAKHRHCVRHLYNNFKLLHKGLELKQRLWAAARASTVP
ncbi:PREDICTED: transposon, partial [Prunus dulcis]